MRLWEDCVGECSWEQSSLAHYIILPLATLRVYCLAKRFNLIFHFLLFAGCGSLPPSVPLGIKVIFLTLARLKETNKFTAGYSALLYCTYCTVSDAVKT